MGNIFNKDFQEFIIALNEEGVEYILVGGYAVILHGYHRTTGDLDIWVNPTSANYTKLMKAFLSFGLPTEVITENDFLNNSNMDVFTFGRPPVSIDLMTAVKGLDFSEAFEKAVINETQRFVIRLLNYRQLIQAKLASGRFRDLNDVEMLEEE